MSSNPAILLQRLESVGFFAAYSLLGDGNFRPYDWGKMAGQLSDETAIAWRFFLLGEALSESALRKLIGSEPVDFLKKFRLCQEQGTGLSLGSLSLVTYRGSSFFIDRGSAPDAYFGDDTKGLMSLVPKLEQGRCLAAFPHTAVALLPGLAGSRVEVEFTRGPHNRNLIAANLLLNQVQGVHAFRLNPRGVYDLIVAACPSTFEPPGIKMPVGLAGGRDGRRHLRELLSLAKRFLAPGGRLVTTFLFFAQKDSKNMQEEISKLLAPIGLSYQLLVCSKHLMQPGIPVFNMLFTLAAAGRPNSTKPSRPSRTGRSDMTSSAGSPVDTEAIARKILRHVQAMNFEAAYLVKATLFHETRPNRREINDFSDIYYGSWTF